MAHEASAGPEASQALLAVQVSDQPLHSTAEPVQAFFDRVDDVWQEAVSVCKSPTEGKSQDGHNVVLVTHGSVSPKQLPCSLAAQACIRKPHMPCAMGN